jgi:hypothetical protein
MLDLAAAGDLAELARFAVPETAGSFAEAMHWATGCSDGWATSDRAAAASAVDDERGAYRQVLGTTWIIDRCKRLGLGAATDDPGPTGAGNGDGRLVMVGGFDANQAVDWPDRIADRIGGATKVRVAWAGHVVTMTPCGFDTVEAFLDNPDEPDVRCDPDGDVEWKPLRSGR